MQPLTWPRWTLVCVLCLCALVHADVGATTPFELQTVYSEREAQPLADPFYVVYTSPDGRSGQIDGGFILAEFFHTMRILEDAYGWQFFIEPTEAKTWDDVESGLNSAFGRLPDVILVFIDEHTGSRLAKALAALPDADSRPRPRLVFVADDLQYYSDDHRERKAAIYKHFDVVASTYAYAMKSFYPEFRPKRLVWHPHSATYLFALPFNANPQRKVLLSGETNPRWYTLRNMIKRKYIETVDPRFVYLKHPGYEGDFDANQRGVGMDYGRTLNQHLVCMTCSSVYNYVVAKMFEIPATGCLLMVDDAATPHLAKLGFIKDRHYVAFNRTNVEAVVSHLLSPEAAAKVDSIRLRAMRMVRARHMVTMRAHKLHEIARGLSRERMSASQSGDAVKQSLHGRKKQGLLL
jgi:Glycosyl transferases group 1